MRITAKCTVCTILILGFAVGIAQSQPPQQGAYIEEIVTVDSWDQSEAPASSATQSATSTGYEYPASAGYTPRPIRSAQPLPAGPALDRAVPGAVPMPDPGIPPRRIGKCKTDQMGSYGPQPYPIPGCTPLPCGPPPLPCGPVCMPAAPVTWY